MPHDELLRKTALAGQFNAALVEQMHERWKRAPDSIPESWQHFFAGFELAMCPRSCVAAQRARAQSQVNQLILAYRYSSHLAARTNPLEDNPPAQPNLDPAAYGFTAGDLETVYDTGTLQGEPRATLREILGILQDTYCRSVGVEYMHISNAGIRKWLQEQMETVRNRPEMECEQREEILSHLARSEIFETFLHSRYPGQKRFSLEGGDTLIPAMRAFIDLAPELGVKEIVFGMSHRGRLNVLANILEKPLADIFDEFEDNFLPGSVYGGGDVKYHKGFSSNHVNKRGNRVHLSLTANPSHLEAVDPVVEGKVRAKQRLLGDTETRTMVVPFVIHGEAGFSGQGIVCETLNLSQLRGYTTGGTVHFIINNQIGFTTMPADQHSTTYASDVAKMVEAPVFHVNGEDPEAVVFVTELALRFRQAFGRDAVVDMLCYRRHGHNETDDPSVTQPIQYGKIKNRPSVRKLYTAYLIENCAMTGDDEKRLDSQVRKGLQEAYEEVKHGAATPLIQAHTSLWKGLNEPFSRKPVDTGVDQPTLLAVTRALTTIPEGFKLHTRQARTLGERAKAVEQSGIIDWATAEAFAFGSLVLEGIPVRLSGQDSARGTFAHRHAVWFDTETEKEHVPLNSIRAGQARFCVYNSLLSEAAVLGFDYGYSLVDPNMLVVWEAQFGDFANGAQVIIDNFIVSSESKWNRSSGLVMLLPHGCEGQGPEHSNAYLERYLAAAADNNIQVCNLTTPAQLFHALRRQIKRPFRRPLIVMAPKSLLRHPQVVSPISDFIDGRFAEILDDPGNHANAARLIFCSGKIYYELVQARQDASLKDSAIVRIEQLYPFADEQMERIRRRYKKIKDVLWVQEETRNRGAWTFMSPKLDDFFSGHPVQYVGRPPGASPAAGSLRLHRTEQARIIQEALGQACNVAAKGRAAGIP